MRKRTVPLSPLEFLEVLYRQIELGRPPDDISHLIETHFDFVQTRGDLKSVQIIFDQIAIENIKVPYHLLLMLQLASDSKERTHFKDRLRDHLRPMFPGKYMRWLEEFDA